MSVRGGWLLAAILGASLAILSPQARCEAATSQDKLSEMFIWWNGAMKTPGALTEQAFAKFFTADAPLVIDGKEVMRGPAGWADRFQKIQAATDGGGVAQGLMAPDEIKAAVDIARRQGVNVTAHSGSASATREAVELGVRGIEHGYFLDRQVLKLMHERGVWFVPTIIVSQPATFEFFKRVGAPQWYMARVREVGKDHWQALKMAIEEKVNIAVGSDQFPFEPNDGTTATIREAEYYVEAGMTPLQGLQAATIQPARMLGMEAQIGSLTSGKFADIVAVDANPLKNFSALRSLAFVMKQGYVYRNDWAKPAAPAGLPPATEPDQDYHGPF